MAYHIEIEGSATPITALRGETILAALLRQGVAFTYSCLSGTCGSCKCRLICGTVNELPFSENVVTAAERENSVVLACRSEIQGAVRIQLPAPSTCL